MQVLHQVGNINPNVGVEGPKEVTKNASVAENPIDGSPRAAFRKFVAEHKLQANVKKDPIHEKFIKDRTEEFLRNANLEQSIDAGKWARFEWLTKEKPEILAEYPFEVSKYYAYHGLWIMTERKGPSAEEAIPYFYKALELDKNNFSAFLFRAKANIKIGNSGLCYETAFEDLNKCIQLKPTNWDLYYQRANAIEIVRGNLPGPDGRRREYLAVIPREFWEINYIFDYKTAAKNGHVQSQTRLRELNIRWDL